MGHAHQVDVYSFSMIAYQLFELQPPFAGMDPVDAARKAALAEERPPLQRLNAGTPTMKARAPTPCPLICYMLVPHAQVIYLQPLREGRQAEHDASGCKLVQAARS